MRQKLVAIASLLLAVAVLAILFSVLWTRIHRQSDPSPIQADPLNLVDAFHMAANGDSGGELLMLLQNAPSCAIVDLFFTVGTRLEIGLRISNLLPKFVATSYIHGFRTAYA